MKEERNYPKSRWIRCPRCLNPEVEITDSGIVRCDQCKLEVEMFTDDS